MMWGLRRTPMTAASAPPPPKPTSSGDTEPAQPATARGDAATSGSLATPVWQVLWASAEARLLAVGVAMSLVVVVAVAVGLVVAPAPTLKFAAVIGLNTVVGPPAGMSFGFASGLGHAAVVGSTFVGESAQTLVLYPLFVLGWRNLIDTRRFAPVLDRLRVAAENGQRRVHPFGVVGVFLFVFVPLWMTGPVVGAIIGFLIGLRPAVNVAVVLAATAFSLVFYAAFIEQVEAWTAALHPYALFAAIAAVAAVAWAVRRRLRRRDAA